MDGVNFHFPWKPIYFSKRPQTREASRQVLPVQSGRADPGQASSAGALSLSRCHSGSGMDRDPMVFRCSGYLPSICLRIFFYFPLLVLKGIYHYWKYLQGQLAFFRAPQAMLENMSTPDAQMLQGLRRTCRRRRKSACQRSSLPGQGCADTSINLIICKFSHVTVSTSHSTLVFFVNAQGARVIDSFKRIASGAMFA